MEKYKWLDDLPNAERRALAELLHTSKSTDPQTQTAIRNCVAQILKSRGRHLARSSSDRAHRVLIGARVSRSMAARCRAAAQITDRSLYRLVTDALAAELARVDDDVRPTNTSRSGQQKDDLVDRTGDVRPDFAVIPAKSDPDSQI